MKKAQEQVEVAETRLTWIKQQLPAILAECAVSAANLSTSDHLVDSNSLPEAASKTDIQKSHLARSGKSTARSNPQVFKSKKRLIDDVVLGPVHSFKIHKAADRKTSQPRRQSIVPARFDTTKTLSSLAKVPSRRDSRLCDVQKKSVSVKSDLAADPDNDPQRGNEKPALNLIDTKPSNSCRRVLRSKPRRHGEGSKSDLGLAKSVGISKRRSRKRSKVND